MRIIRIVSLLALLAAVRIDSAAPKTDFLALPPGFERFYFSLRAFSERFAQASAENKLLPSELTNLCGMAFIQGYMLGGADDKDLIIIGLRTKKRPVLHLDDLVVCIRNVWGEDEAPFCSLDPTDESIRRLRNLSVETSGFGAFQAAVGPQMTRIGGVPRESRFARVMIAADYHMKKISQGTAAASGVTSYLDLSLIEAAKNALGQGQPDHGFNMSRFWFQLENKTPSFQEGSGIVWLTGCKVALQTEKQVTTPEGKRYDATEDDPHATAFAQSFSTAFGPLSYTIPVFGDLDNLYRLRALFLALKARGDSSLTGIDFTNFLPSYRLLNAKPLPESLPGLANHREWSNNDGVRVISLSSMVCGGASLDMKINAATSFKAKNFYELAALRSEIASSRPSGQSISWEAPSTASYLQKLNEKAQKLRDQARSTAYASDPAGLDTESHLPRIRYETRRLEALDKTAVALHSIDGKVGVVELKPDDDSNNGILTTSFGINVIAVIPRVGHGPGLKLGMGGAARDFVFVNVGNAPLRFDGFVLETGEYARLKGTQFIKVKIEEI